MSDKKTDQQKRADEIIDVGLEDFARVIAEPLDPTAKNFGTRVKIKMGIMRELSLFSKRVATRKKLEEDQRDHAKEHAEQKPKDAAAEMREIKEKLNRLKGGAGESGS